MESRSGMHMYCVNATVCSRMLNYNFVAKFTCPHGICLYDCKVVSSHFSLLTTSSFPLNCNDSEDRDAFLLHSIKRTSVGQEGKRLVWMTCSAGLSWNSHIKCMLSGKASLLVPLESGQPISLTKRFIHEPWPHVFLDFHRTDNADLAF
ncbi:hypothetical protein Peur_073888 [Populus x canadensis]